MADLPALPAVHSLAACADHALVLPYLTAATPTLWALVDAAKASPADILEWYLRTNPLLSGLIASVLLGFGVWVLSEVTRNYSQVDRLWSVLPFAYVLHFDLWARRNGVPSARLDLAVFCLACWSVRLTFNYWRKGGYSWGSEDYRWAVIKTQIGSAGMFFINATFISFIQSILLLLMASPAYVLLLSSQIEAELTIPDAIFGGIILCLVGIEIVADQQQWNYQIAKQAYLKSAKLPANSTYSQEDLDRGFVVSGLWSWSRHPNFAAEQAIWFVFYQWGAFTSRSMANWTAVGAIGLFGIFHGSTWLTEKISAKKYPQYKDYQKLVGRFLPGALGW